MVLNTSINLFLWPFEVYCTNWKKKIGKFLQSQDFSFALHFQVYLKEVSFHFMLFNYLTPNLPILIKGAYFSS